MVVVADRFQAGMARQLERLGKALAGGMPRRGWKIGINVPEVLGRLELPHPGVAWIDGRKVLPTGAVLEAPAQSRLHVEPEVAILLGRGVAAGCPADVARGCIEALHPALEIVDYAIPVSGLDDVVAGCMFHHATVLGAPAPLDAARGLGREWPVLRVAGEVADPPRDDLVPADLGALVSFTADYLAAFGRSLEAGDLLLSGSYAATAAAIGPGQEAVAGFGPGQEAVAGFGPLGRASVRVAT